MRLDQENGCPARLLIAQWVIGSRWGEKPVGHADCFGTKKADRHEKCCTVTTREVIAGKSIVLHDAILNRSAVCFLFDLLDHWFQSPSRGGHLRRDVVFAVTLAGFESFSPLHEGDTSVGAPGRAGCQANSRFSPLHEGDTSVGVWRWELEQRFVGFSPLHEGDTSVGTRTADAAAS